MDSFKYTEIDRYLILIIYKFDISILRIFIILSQNNMNKF